MGYYGHHAPVQLKLVLENGRHTHHRSADFKCRKSGCLRLRWAPKGGVCRSQGATQTKQNQAKKGGVCRSHGAEVKVYRCSNEGCTNRAKKEECASGMGKCRSQTMQQGRMHESSHQRRKIPLCCKVILQRHWSFSTCFD